jgi:tetratricopeptide (TPR) repeat protein
MPVPQAIERCRSMLSQADLGGQARVLCRLGSLEAMAGRFAEARSLVADARAMFGELGQDSNAADDCSLFEARIELVAGDVAAASHVLEGNCEALRRMGNYAQLANRAAELAETLLVLGRNREAEQWCWLSEETGASDDVWTQIGWRSAKAKLRAHGGRLADAEALAGEALALVEATDALNHRAKTLLDLAEVVGLGGRAEEAREAAEEALALFSQKGNIAGASRAEVRLAELAPA